jgi:hypothetical protein
MHTDLTEADWASFDGVLPEQVLCDHARQLPGSGTRALMSAVLEEAVMCLTSSPPSVGRSRRPTTQLALQAERWVRSADQSWPFAFENVCAALGLDAARLRAALLQAARTPRAMRVRRSHRVHAFVALAGQTPAQRSTLARDEIAPRAAAAKSVAGA